MHLLDAHLPLEDVQSFCSSLQSSVVFTALNSKLSSTNNQMKELGIERNLLMSRKKRKGPRTVPSGTTEETGTVSDGDPSRIRCFVSEKRSDPVKNWSRDTVFQF